MAETCRYLGCCYRGRGFRRHVRIAFVSWHGAGPKSWKRVVTWGVLGTGIATRARDAMCQRRIFLQF